MPGYKKHKYEIFNKVSETGDSIYIPTFDELPGGQVFVNVDSMLKEERDQLFKRLGPKHDVVTEDEI